MMAGAIAQIGVDILRIDAVQSAGLAQNSSRLDLRRPSEKRISGSRLLQARAYACLCRLRVWCATGF